MGLDSWFDSLNLTLQVSFIDVLLSGDNAVMIALACRTLPPLQMRRAMLIGAGVAIALRIVLTTIVAMLLSMPYLKLMGGAALVVIALRLIHEEGQQVLPQENPEPRHGSLWSAIGTILVADIVMSVDNVLGLAAVTQGNIRFLVLGVLVSVPLLMYGSLFVCGLLQRHPVLIQAGGALLGWVAGGIAVADPVIADWVRLQAPALAVMVPVLVTVFVLLEGRIMREARATAVTYGNVSEK
ncbi:MAG: TerC family protein [Nitrospirae bacterium]|nr:TerC family protein [Magnetococcales bacterium]